MLWNVLLPLHVSAHLIPKLFESFHPFQACSIQKWHTNLDNDFLMKTFIRNDQGEILIKSKPAYLLQIVSKLMF